MGSNDFEKQIDQITGGGLHSCQIDILQINLGLRCNQQCIHCHLEASPLRRETMEWPIMELALEAANHSHCRLVDLTGGAPELSIGWDGTLYDCDFNLALGLPVNHGAPDHIKSFRLSDLSLRRIVTGEHCFGCTAGSGSSCQGGLV
jgi:hypothetical protein